MSLSPFDWLNSVNENKKNLIKDGTAPEKDYLPFLVNRGLSYFPDSIMYANEMNRFPFLDKKLQYEFLLNSLKKRKRFSKWEKKPPDSEDIQMVKEFYNFSTDKALEALKVLTSEQLKEMKKLSNKGGGNG